MIDLILPEARMSFAGPLMQMHHDRKQVFVDRLGWRLRAPGSWLEVDEFDSDFAVYLMARSQDGGHEGSVRLLPSIRPHMLSSLFRNLCPGDLPVGEDCWEISRLLSNPRGVAGTSVLRVHRLLALGLIEFAAINDIKRYTLVAEAHRVPALLSVGWRVLPLGLPTEVDGEDLQALQIVIEPGTLETMRGRLRIVSPVLRLAQDQRKAA